MTTWKTFESVDYLACDSSALHVCSESAIRKAAPQKIWSRPERHLSFKARIISPAPYATFHNVTLKIPANC